MERSNKADGFKIILAAILLIVSSGILSGQSLRVPNPGNRNCVGTAISSGFFLDKPAWFLGLSFDYAYFITEKWIVLGGIAYDQEHKTQASENENKVVHTLTPNLAIGYALNSRMAVGVGIGKGLWDTDNTDQILKYTSSGNITIGVLWAYSIYLEGPHCVDVTLGLERGLITVETNVTLEIGYGFCF